MPETFTFEEAVATPPQPAMSPEDLLRVAADAKTQGYESFTVPAVGGGKVRMTPQGAASVQATPQPTKAGPTSFSFEEALGKKEEAPKREEPGMLERMKEQSLPAVAGRFAASSNLEMEQMAKIGAKGPDGKSEFDRERERRLKAGEKADPASMLKWASDTARERVHGKAPADTPITDQLKAIGKAAVNDPLKFGRDLLESVAAHPEYFLAGPFAPFLAVGESALEQYPEKGRVDWGQASLEGVMTATPAAVTHGLLGLGHARAAAAKGAKVTPEADIRAAEQVKTKVQQGTPPLDAADQVLAAMGVKPEERASLVNDAKEVINATETRVVEKDHIPEHQRVDTSRVEEAKPQADRGDSTGERPQVEAEKEVAAKEPKPHQFKSLPEGLKGRWITPEDTFTILKEAGIDEEAARGMAGKVPISIDALRARLTKFMGGQRYADSVLADVLLNKQAGKVDPKLLGAMAAVGLGAAGAYALTQDKSKAIATAMLIGATAAGISGAMRVGRAVRSVFKDSMADKSLKPMGPFNEFLARPQMVEYATRHWERTTDALLTGLPDKNASRIKVRDWLQGHRDMVLNSQEQAYADEIKRFLDTLGGMAHDAGTIERLRENYLTGLYQKKPFKAWRDVLRELSTEEAFRGNYTGMSRNSRFNLQKVIPDYRTAERLHSEGKFPLIPLTNDPVRIAGHYSRSVQKTIAVNKLVSDLKNTPSNRFWEATGIPVPVIIGMNWDESMGRIMKASDRMAKHLGTDPLTAQAMKKTGAMDARSDYVMVKHPSLNGMLVHKDVAPMLKMLFDTSDPSMIHRGLYAASMAGKSLFFTVSFFHPVALGVVAATLALPRLSKHIVALPKYWKTIPAAAKTLKNGENAPLIETASRAGLEFLRAPQDMDPNIISRLLNYGQETLGPVGIPLKALRVANDWVQNFLWNMLFPTLKLAAFDAELQRAIVKSPNIAPELAARQIAKATNDLFGGQNWFNLANDVPEPHVRRLAQALFSPYSRRIQQIMFLSPDWNISAARAWYEGIKSVVPGVSAKASDSMYRSYLIWSALTYLGAANMLSNHYTGHNIWDQKDWTYVDRGDGTKIQLNKHFMEMAHLTMDPQKFLLNKLNLLPKEAIDQYFGKEWVSWDDKKGIYGPPMTEYPFGLTRPMHAAGQFVPLSIANIIRDPAAGLSGMFSFGIYGTPYTQREERAAETARAKGKDVEAARERARKRNERERRQKFKGSNATQ